MILQQLQRSNPELIQMLLQHPDEFQALLNEGVEDLLGEEGEEGHAHGVVELTEAEMEAVQRLEAMGFPRHLCIEAYLSCDKNEELAANFLLENMGMLDD